MLKPLALLPVCLAFGCTVGIAPLAAGPGRPVVELRSDFTDPSHAIRPIHNFWSVNARTERASHNSKPAHGIGRPKVSTVRMLGGWSNQDLDGDAYKWNGTAYVYDWKVLTDRIDGWLNNGWDIFQIVLDNPPWAFQRDLTFVEKPDGLHFLASSRNGTYGNVLPPNDPKAWSDFIQALMHKLIATYGREKVLSWRFRVGSEIDTRPQHWAGTMDEFFAHYKNTVEAVHAVLPMARIGTHFREASYRGKYVDYRGKTEPAYGPYFVAWAKQNHVPYDFLAISFYPNVNKIADLDLAEVYAHEIAPIKDHPDWNSAASFEIHEYKFISKMLRANFVSVATVHGAAYFAMLAKLAIENDIREIFQWGSNYGGLLSPDAMTQTVLQSMEGNNSFRNTKSGSPRHDGTTIDAIISQRRDADGFDALVFSFTPASPEFLDDEGIRLSLTVLLPPNTSFSYRVASVGRRTFGISRFFLDHPKSERLIASDGWRIPEIHSTAAPSQALSKEGTDRFDESTKHYHHYNKLVWSGWRSGQTRGDQVDRSTITIPGTIPSFGVQKYEIRLQP